MLNLYNRTARRMAEEYLMAMSRLDASTNAITVTEDLARTLSDAGIPAEATWLLGEGCQLRVQCAIEVISTVTQQIELVLAESGFGMLTSGQPNSWVLINIREDVVPLNLSLIIEEF